MDLDEILNESKVKYPSDDERFNKQLQSLKRKVCQTNIFACEICQKEFRYKKHYLRHREAHKCSFTCSLCNREFNRLDNLKRHENSHYMNYRNFESSFKCKHCGIECKDYSSLFEHVSSSHPLGDSHQSGGGHASRHVNAQAIHRTSSESSMDGAVNELNIFPESFDRYDLLAFFSNIRPEIVEHLRQQCDILSHIKWTLSVQIELMRETVDGIRDLVEPHFRSKTYSLLSKDDLDDSDAVIEAFRKQFKSFDEYIAHGSGWTLKKIIRMVVHTVQYKPLGGTGYFELPQSIRTSKAVINVQNKDSKCFLWAILAGLHPIKDNANRVSNYKQYEHNLNMSGITFPVAINQIHKFEKQNNISVNVIGFEDDDFFPLYMTKLRNADAEIDLLYLKNGERSHYCFIKNLNRLLARTTPVGRGYKFCRYCLQAFTSQRVLDKHMRCCSKHDAQHTEFPAEGVDDILEFNDFAKQMRVPFIIYADFEAFCRNISTDSDTVPSKQQRVIRTKEFRASGFGYQVVCSDHRYTKSPVIYRGLNVTKHFLECLLEEEKYIKDTLDYIEPLQMTEKDEESFNNSTHCHICDNKFNAMSGKVRDHCHVSGKFRGAACSNCNLNFKHPNFIPVVFHNLRGFDAHLICESLGLFKKQNITCIPNNMEKYISFSLGNLRFIDSYQFLPTSLSELAVDLANEGIHYFDLFKREYPEKKHQELLMRKGVYPYSWIDSEIKFFEKNLPPREKFYNEISKSHISAEDYEHAKEVWDTFNIQNMGDYHDLYLKSDILILGCIFERFRDICMEDYSLDPAHFYTSPGLAWAAALKMTKCKLSLITDPDIYLFWESGLRGGMSQISNRYAKANNPYLSESYDKTKPVTYIMFQDCSNLYGKGMSLPLPTGGMRFLDDSEISQFDASCVTDDAQKGYLVECDLEYPSVLHDSHSDYPLAPEAMTVPNEWLSQQSHEHWRKLHPLDPVMQTRVKTPKLICSLLDKKNYIVHYRNLKLYLQLGMKLNKVHRVLEFDQSPWLKPYIDFNSERRKQAKGEFKKSFYKLMNNAVFGKTMENVRNRVDVQLVHRQKRLRKQVAKSSFQRCKIFTSDLVGVQMQRVKLKLNKPLYVGMAILDLSKCIMYNYHYNHMVKKYPAGHLKLLMTDTDSLLYQVQTFDIYKDMLEDKHLYDLSNYPKDHFLYDETNKKRPGTFKDETGGLPISEFVGLRPKMYSLKYNKIMNVEIEKIDDEIEKLKSVDQTVEVEAVQQVTDKIAKLKLNIEKLTAKGVAKSTIKSDLRHLHYKTCLFDGTRKMCEMNLIQSNTHKLYVVHVNKLGLCGLDDKRYIMDNGLDTLAFGHYSI